MTNNRSNFVGPMLTDLYQLTMLYAYWKSGKHEDMAVFDVFYRKNPFGGEYAVFAGLDDVLEYIANFRFSPQDLDFLQNGKDISLEALEAEFESRLANGYIKRQDDGYLELVEDYGVLRRWEKVEYPTQTKHINSPLSHAEPEFFEWLARLDCSKVKVTAISEGTIVFPKIPLISFEGPLGITQLLETATLNLINFATLITTNAARYRVAAGLDKTLLEFGLRRAQGPDGGMSASRYAYLGGFDGTSNVLASQLFDIPMRGTHAHAFVQSFTSLGEVSDREFLRSVLHFRSVLGFEDTNDGELAAFCNYALAFPNGFLALVDTYDTLKSGVPNFLCVAAALDKLGHRAVGIRLDSGDLAYLSRQSRKLFEDVAEKLGIRYLEDAAIAASNDIDEETLHSLNQEGHEIDIFGIGTHLVTCWSQAALGAVDKLVEINGVPRIKLSNEVGKITIPGRKDVYRLYDHLDRPVVDLMTGVEEDPPEEGKRVLCRHPFDETKRVIVIPYRVEELRDIVWDRGQQTQASRTLREKRQYMLDHLAGMRQDHLRAVNPTPYKVSVSAALYDRMHQLWQAEAPVNIIT